MRKHSVRKFIHAVLDCLPLLVIPIFAIYSQNHEINDNTLQVQENKAVDFNQLIQIEGLQNTVTTNGITFTNNNNGTITIDGTATDRAVYNIYTSNYAFNCVQNHKYYIKMFNTQNSITLQWGITLGSWIGTNQNYITTATGNQNWQFWIAVNNGTEASMFNVTPQVFDLTQMFGEGNEPTKEQFDTYFTHVYYPYTLEEEVVIENYETITYNDTDIMSQFMYVTYNAVDKYFNMNKVFNLGNIWTWVNNTLFGGQAPLSAFIVYNVIAYEFIMDIIFLIYMVFMWLIDWIESCIDRFLKKAS